VDPVGTGAVRDLANRVQGGRLHRDDLVEAFQGVVGLDDDAPMSVFGFLLGRLHEIDERRRQLRIELTAVARQYVTDERSALFDSVS
jgi:hypothetical protein